MSMIKVEIHGKAFAQLIHVQAHLEEILQREVSVGEVLDLLLDRAYKATDVHKCIKSYQDYESNKNTQHGNN